MLRTRTGRLACSTPLLVALILLGVGAASPPPSTPPVQAPPSPPSPPTAATALSRFSAKDQGLITRQAKFTFVVPSVDDKPPILWNGATYAEFRDVLGDYDRAGTRPLPPRCRAWGFAEGKRRPSTNNCPTPLWEVPRSVPASDRAYAPFIFITTDLLSEFERKRGGMATVRRVLPGVTDAGEKWVEMEVREFPGAGNDNPYLPPSISNRFWSGTALIPPGVKFEDGSALRGEYLLVSATGAERPASVQAHTPLRRLIHAADARVTPEQLARAILDGRAVAAEWKFTRTERAGAETITWTRREIAPSE